MEAMEWVERLGGWAVLVYIVAGMMRRQDKVIDALKDAVDAFSGFRADLNAHNRAVERTQKETLYELRAMARERPD